MQSEMLINQEKSCEGYNQQPQLVYQSNVQPDLSHHTCRSGYSSMSNYGAHFREMRDRNWIGQRTCSKPRRKDAYIGVL